MSYAIKYRPENLDHFLGAEDLPIEEWGKSGWPEAILISGHSGTGKTTLASILARMLSDDITEENAGDLGIDDIRQLAAKGRTRSLTSEYRVIIINEAQRLTKASIDALLDPLERSPDTTWIFTTNEPSTLPPTFRRRTFHLEMPKATRENLRQLCRDVLQSEGKKVSKDTLDLVLDRADGSWGIALATLEQAVLGNVDSVLTKAAKTEEWSVSLVRLFLKPTTQRVRNTYAIFADEFGPAVLESVMKEVERSVLQRDNGALAEKVGAEPDKFLLAASGLLKAIGDIMSVYYRDGRISGAVISANLVASALGGI